MSVKSARKIRGQRSYLAGQSAESAVAKLYTENAHSLLDVRWRGAAGEIDLIFRKDGVLVFVEVKKSKGAMSAAALLSERQIERLLLAAQEYLALSPAGLLTPSQFDVALVSADGAIEIIANALSTD